MHFLKVFLIVQVTCHSSAKASGCSHNTGETQRQPGLALLGLVSSRLSAGFKFQFYNRGSFKFSYQCSHSSACPQQNPAPEYSDKPSMWRQTPGIPQLPSPVTGQADLPILIIEKNVSTEGFKSAPIFFWRPTERIQTRSTSEKSNCSFFQIIDLISYLEKPFSFSFFIFISPEDDFIWKT